jgi:hypothetical protein
MNPYIAFLRIWRRKRWPNCAVLSLHAWLVCRRAATPDDVQVAAPLGGETAAP